MRLALEILDRRRSPSRIGAILAPEVVDLLRSVAAAPIHPARRLGAATVLRVHTADSADPAMLELFGTYRRGERVFAFAGRMHERRTATGTPTWCVTSLRVS
ncbi:hypothetical protein Rrhod_3163 [Rhodococcus rhodnii LMG 5362]|uniref:Uncharacterized protein n=1 Tax=Rhodococcus rhodnii LMG 5362 TaxID=1273125 RepID=R7WJD1_9NOCA|nr:hypothetical protein Rrhod_3163 [Rhodococcus rhodnii LMG 5362]